MTREITRETPIKELGIFYGNDSKKLESALGITKVEDLAQFSLEELYTFGSENYLLSFNKIRALGRALHQVGLTYKDEYVGTYLPEELINESVYKLNIPEKIKSHLRKSNLILTVGELATTPYVELRKIRNIGDVAYAKLRKALAEVGVLFKWNELTDTEKREAKRTSPELDITVRSPYVSVELLEITPEDEEERTLAATVQKMRLENAQVMVRIKRKQELLAQYQTLLLEQAALDEKEASLNHEFLQTAAKIKEKGNKV